MRLGLSGPRLGTALWMAGAAVGIVGGFAALLASPIAIVPELIAAVALAAARPRCLGVAGALAGHGLAWSWLLVTSSMICAISCDYSLPYGPAHVEDSWQLETRLWLVVALLVLLAGLTLTVVAARYARDKRRLAD